MNDDMKRKIVIRPEELARAGPFSPAPISPIPPVLLPPPPSAKSPFVPFALVLFVGLVLVGAVAIAWLLTRENGNRNAVQAKAIRRVGQMDKQLGAETVHAVPAGAAPSRLAQAIDVYCKRTITLDFTDCPAEFVVAYKQHIRAWSEMRDVVARLPDNFLEGAFAGFFNALLRGEKDGGVNRMEAGVIDAERRVRSTWEEVERIAAKYDALID